MKTIIITDQKTPKKDKIKLSEQKPLKLDFHQQQHLISPPDHPKKHKTLTFENEKIKVK